MTDKELWKDINKSSPPNDITIELANIQEMMYWDPEVNWKTTGRYKDNKLYSIKYVKGMGNEKDVIFKARPTHWRELQLSDLEKAREIIWTN